MTNWYDLHHKTALCLILIIVRSNKVIRITAGKLFQLSIATFGDVSNACNTCVFRTRYNIIKQDVKWFRIHQLQILTIL